ncbi:hypothetical protein FXF59_25060, partial [Microbispora tritici]
MRAKNSQVATLVDRKSRYLTMVALPSRHTTTVIPALQQAPFRWPAGRRSGDGRETARRRGRLAAGLPSSGDGDGVEVVQVAGAVTGEDEVQRTGRRAGQGGRD